MADKIDHLLTDYFTGQLEANIKLRKLELSYHNDHDDNIGGGRMQNNIVRNTETTMLKVESDRLIQDWLYASQVIDLMFALELDNVQRIIKARYGKRRTWIDISMSEHVDVRTLSRWRDDFKNKLKRPLKNVL
ncbi:DUF722 domain-containing protein [Weissella paramesenteroides]|uniref:DUF722 domain-containing protein n=1 Tax=Weissella paramesenteroides TaxID=1249 RepID=UPI00207343E6|nr:RinA family protein [Weissella paramesenteroides]MCM6766617.1 RinA family protein [Weissella paramesenteroides]MCM6769039.1 RinA family protein [Weissella paramesenteroides]MCM6771653.1 RinA family protein [Weissella paramesenteroides]MCM6779254.1 RinA family protein [Weissella paramesenteroides]